MTEHKQKFHASFLKNSKFGSGSLRGYFMDRDLGMTEATGGMVFAEVHRANGAPPEGGSGTHYHTVDFQMNYLLKGWMKVEIEGEGEITFEAGDAWLQPPKINHNVLGFSEDLEVLEICMPANFGTEEA